MHIELLPASRGDRMLLETLSPTVRCLTGDIVYQRPVFFSIQRAVETAICYTPEPIVTNLCCKEYGLNLLVDGVIIVIPISCYSHHLFLRYNNLTIQNMKKDEPRENSLEKSAPNWLLFVKACY